MISQPGVAGTKVAWRATPPALAPPRTFTHAGLGNICCDSVGRKGALIPMVSPALPCMQWALAGAKRLECGSLLPLCLHAQTTCLSPYRIFAISPRPVIRPVSILQIGPPNIHRLGAAKNRRAPADALE